MIYSKNEFIEWLKKSLVIDSIPHSLFPIPKGIAVIILIQLTIPSSFEQNFPFAQYNLS